MSEISRRTFLHVAGATTAAMIGGCSCQQQPRGRGAQTARSAGPAVDLDADPWAAWRELRAAVRGSPDHLAARAEALVRKRDAEALFAFVRDEIATVPPQADGLLNALGAMRFGTRAALRSGCATPREKAELLADLLRHAGHDAVLVQATLDPAIRSGELLPAPPVRRFAPAASPEQLAGWRQRTGAVQVAALRDPDTEGLAQRIAATVQAALPQDARVAREFDWAAQPLPAVQATVGGRSLLLNPLLRAARPDLPLVGNVMPALSANAPGRVDIGLLVASGRDPDQRTEVCSASWPVDRLVGRRVVARFIPAGDPAITMVLGSDTLHVFTAMLALDGPGIQPGAAEDCVLGDEVSLSGSVVHEHDDGALTVDGEPLGVTGEPATARISTLAVQLDAGEFPLVRLAVTPRDADGSVLTGVAGAALEIFEDDRPVQFLVRRSAPPLPRVLLLLDTSKSLPAGFREEQAARFAGDLHRRILGQYPGALLRAATINYGVATASPAWTEDPQRLVEDARRLIGDGSEIWSALADAQRYGANLIVIVTDGQSTDSDARRISARAAIEAGPPVIAIGAGQVQRTTLDEIARLTRGAAFAVTEPQQAVTAVLERLAARTETPLHLEYRTREGAPAERRVRIAGPAASAQGRYDVPAPEARRSGPALLGLYLRVRWEGREMLHTLAGIPAESAVDREQWPADAAAAVRAAMPGCAMLAVEGDPPTLATWFDDLLEARLSLAPLAATGPEPAATLKALAAGVWHLDADLLALQAPLPTEGAGLTFATGPRVTVTVERPLPGGGLQRSTTTLPCAGFATAAADPAESFALTLRRTARLAAAEAVLHEDNAWRRLESASLAPLAANAPAARSGPHAAHARLLDAWASATRLLPAGDARFAFWAVDARGGLNAVTGEGAFGGRSALPAPACPQSTDAADLMDWLGTGRSFAAGLGAASKRLAAASKRSLRVAAIAPRSAPEPGGTACAEAAQQLLCRWSGDTCAVVFAQGDAAAAIAGSAAVAAGSGALGCAQSGRR